jgi:hypothetical protein
MAQAQQSGGFQQYDPTSAAPYQAPALPEPTPAMPSPLPTQMPEINGAVKRSGAIATVADGILRGFMHGRAYHQAAQVMKFKKKSDDLQNSYNQDAVRLYQLTQAGVDPNSDEYKAAKSSVDGSWGALMDFYGQHIEGQDDKGKKKSKAKKVEGGIMGALTGGDPMAQSSAWYQVARKLGPPVYGQLAMLNTPQAKAERQATTTAAQNTAGQQEVNAQRIQAEKDRNTVLNIPEDQRTPAQKAQLERAESVLTPVATKGLDEFNQERAAIARKVAEDPNYVLTPSEQAIVAQGRPTFPKQPGSTAPKPGTFGDYLIKKYGENYTAEDYIKARHEAAAAGHIAGAGRSGASEDKNYAKWDQFYREHDPEMGFEERDALVRHKVEGAGQEAAGEITHDAIAEPQQFDNDVISAAIDKLRALPQYKDMKTLDDALANIVGQGDNGYQYHAKSDLGKPDASGKYSGNVDEAGLKALERDLQTQIRAVMSGSKLTALSQSARRAAMGRMQPLFGPAASTGSGAPGSPQAKAAQPRAAASSPSPSGGSKGVVKKSAFLKENPGATDADWQAVKPQLKEQGYDVKDE